MPSSWVHTVLTEFWRTHRALCYEVFFPLVFHTTVIYFDMKYTKSQQCPSLLCQCRQKSVCILHAFVYKHPYIHTLFITVLNYKLQKGALLLLWGFLQFSWRALWIILTLTGKQHKSRNHHNYKIWSVLWIALTKTSIGYMTRRGRDASVKIGLPHGVDLGFSTWGAWERASLLLTHSYSKSWNQEEPTGERIICSWGKP